MKFAMLITFDINADDWAAEYELPDSPSAVTDIVDVLNRAATDGGIADALTSQWPMMREASAVITVGTVIVGGQS